MDDKEIVLTKQGTWSYSETRVPIRAVDAIRVDKDTPRWAKCTLVAMGAAFLATLLPIFLAGDAIQQDNQWILILLSLVFLLAGAILGLLTYTTRLQVGTKGGRTYDLLNAERLGDESTREAVEAISDALPGS